VIRVAFTLVGGKSWLGGHHYLLNLLRSVRAFRPDAVTPVVFAGNDVPCEELAPFESIPGVEVVVSAVFARSMRSRRVAQALIWGLDRRALKVFRAAGIAVVFEPAQFYGWRLPMPAIAWIPDFQDRHLPHMFGRMAHVQRWVGQWTQVLTGRTLMLSSEDARADCERFYPLAKGRTRVVRFAVPSPPQLSPSAIAAVPESHGLPKHYFFLPNQFWRHKNHVCVVRALRILKTQGREIVVAATGNTSDLRHKEHFTNLVREIAAADLSNNFRLLGVVPYEHVLALMHSTAALLNPSYCEGWSTTVEEAKSTGTPMILSDIAVHHEQAGAAAVYFPPDSPQGLAKLLSDFPAAQHDRREAAAQVARVEATARLAQFAAAFCEVVAQSFARIESKAPSQ
jgi:glycosyltransferase involved in cell wall biosynthesis